MIYVETQSTDPYFNFAVEEYFLTQKPQADIVFLFWQTEPTVMLGRFQNAYKELNLVNVERDQVHIVRRQTGGGTIYTDRGGWQFSFIMPEKRETIDFGRFMDPIIEALAKLGVTAEYNSRNDLTVAGRKVSGNAQCSRGNHTLHHGSLLYATDFSKMSEYLNVPLHKLRSKGIDSVRSRTANIKEFCPEAWSSETFAQKMINEILASGAKSYQLSPEDKAAIEQIANQKFRSWDWNFGKNPSFSFEQSAVLTGGLLEIKFEVKQGKITDCRLEGDFFSAGGTDEFLAELKGTDYRYEAVAAILQQEKYQNLLHQISNQEILACMFKDMNYQ